MRDFRDAKAMAQTLRSSLSAKAINISHSESIELVSRMFGVADWNTLAAQIDRGGQKSPATADSPRDTTTRRYLALPMRDLVPFPGGTYPIFAGRPKTLQALDQASKQRREIVIAVQRTPSVDDPTLDDVYGIGVLAGILDLLHLDDGTVKALVQVHRRVAIRNFINEAEGYIANVEDLNEGPILEAPDLVRATVVRFASYAERNGINIPQILLPLGEVREPDLAADVVSKRTRNPGWVADIIASRMKLPIDDKQSLLATLDPVRRLEAVRDHLDA